MRVSKRPRIAATNEKPVSSKLSSVLTKLVQNELLLGSLETKSLEDSSNKDDNNIKLPPVRVGKKLRTIAANRKPASDKLSLKLTKLALRIGEDMKAKKVLF